MTVELADYIQTPRGKWYVYDNDPKVYISFSYDEDP